MKGQRTLLLKGAAWVGAGGMIVNLLSFVSLIALTRLLLPDDFGLVAIAASLSEILNFVTQMSLNQALIQRKKVEKAHFDTAFTLNVIRGVVVTATIVIVAPFVAQFYGDPRLTDLLRFLALTTLITGFINPRLVVFKRKLIFHQTFIMSVSNKVAVFVLSISVALLTRSYWALVVGTVGAAFVNTALSYWLIQYRPRFGISKWRDLMSFSIWLTLGTWVKAMNWRSTPLLLGYFLPTALLGQYRVGDQIMSKSINQAIRPIQSLLFPAFSRLQDDGDRLRKGYMRSQGTICLIVFPMAAGIAVLAEDFVLLTIGAKWLPAVPIIQLYAFARCLRALQNLNAVAMASAETKELFFRDLWLFCIRWPLILAGLYLAWGDSYAMLIGAIIGQTIALAIGTGLNIRLISQISSVSALDHAALSWRALVSIAAMAGAVLLADSALPSTTDLFELAVRVAALATLGAATYFGALAAIWVIQGRKETVEKELALIVRKLATKAIAKVRPS